MKNCRHKEEGVGIEKLHEVCAGTAAPGSLLGLRFETYTDQIFWSGTIGWVDRTDQGLLFGVKGEDFFYRYDRFRGTVEEIHEGIGPCEAARFWIE
jgi:hypothetical protein